MTAENDATQCSLEELEERRRQGKTKIRPDAPEHGVEVEFWASARVVMPPPGKTSVHLRLDSDVLEWFKQGGKGHLSRMNAVLRSFMDAQKGPRGHG
jgi:uncharacterized protein (DUF4415 family)